MEQTLRDLKQRGVLREGRVTRVAVIGPGLDFIDKNEESAYDYYPQQTLQPFALYDSLVRLRLARPNALSMSIFDISSPVIEHMQRARERAGKDTAMSSSCRAMPRGHGRRRSSIIGTRSEIRWGPDGADPPAGDLPRPSDASGA